MFLLLPPACCRWACVFIIHRPCSLPLSGIFSFLWRGSRFSTLPPLLHPPEEIVRAESETIQPRSLVSFLASTGSAAPQPQTRRGPHLRRPHVMTSLNLYQPPRAPLGHR